MGFAILPSWRLSSPELTILPLSPYSSHVISALPRAAPISEHLRAIVCQTWSGRRRGPSIIWDRGYERPLRLEGRKYRSKEFARLIYCTIPRYNSTRVLKKLAFVRKRKRERERLSYRELFAVTQREYGIPTTYIFLISLLN